MCQTPMSRSTGGDVVLALVQPAGLALDRWLTRTEIQAATAEFKASSETSV